MNHSTIVTKRTAVSATVLAAITISTVLSGCSATQQDPNISPSTSAPSIGAVEETTNISLPPTPPPALAEAKSLSELDGQEISLTTGQFLEIIIDYGVPTDFALEIGDGSVLADAAGGIVGNNDVDISLAAIGPGTSKVLIVNKTTEEIVSFEVVVS